MHFTNCAVSLNRVHHCSAGNHTGSAAFVVGVQKKNQIEMNEMDMAIIRPYVNDVQLTRATSVESKAKSKVATVSQANAKELYRASLVAACTQVDEAKGTRADNKRKSEVNVTTSLLWVGEDEEDEEEIDEDLMNSESGSVASRVSTPAPRQDKKKKKVERRQSGFPADSSSDPMVVMLRSHASKASDNQNSVFDLAKGFTDGILAYTKSQARQTQVAAPAPSRLDNIADLDTGALVDIATEAKLPAVVEALMQGGFSGADFCAGEDTWRLIQQVRGCPVAEYEALRFMRLVVARNNAGNAQA